MIGGEREEEEKKGMGGHRVHKRLIPEVRESEMYEAWATESEDEGERHR